MPGAVPKIRTRHADTSPKTSIKNLPNYEYVGNYYSKDFKYISPEVLQRIKRTRNIVAPLKANMEKGTCKLFTRLWFAEVIKGLKQFLYEGSLHGVKYIFEPTFSRKEKLIWIIIMVISVAICAVNIIQLLCKWHTKPFVNVIDSLPTPIWAIPFPTVVLCPHLHVQLSYANVSKLDEREYFFASLVCPQLSHEKKALPQPLNTEENIMMQDFIVKGSPKCTDIVKSCYWKSTHDAEWFAKECCEKMFKPIFTDYGLCFAFNSLPLNSLTNDSLHWQKTFNQNASQLPLKWSLDDGYPKVFPPDPTMIPFRAMASGEVHGLGVELYLNTSEHQFGCDGNNVGFNVLINSPTDNAYTSTVIRLPMNKMTTIKVTPITYKTDAELRTLPPYQRQCYFQDEMKLKYFEFYTDSNCKHDLWMREVKKQCNCVLFNWPRIYIWESICSTKSDFRCVIDVRAKVEEQLTYAYFEDSQEDRTRDAASASCQLACNDILYSSQVFYSDLVSIPGRPEPEWEFKEGEVTRINVHFYDDIFLGQHRHAQYDDYYFAGAIGGLLSLFLGFSIISVAELVYFVLLKPVHLALKETFKSI
ncbi:unnamed protein product [Parnassius mnemosyne]|uniref:Uncharacterized protein n=1 Tax=Parnassius mnemosyne TaxID=213953 RepID=A0AAV1L2P3_9NEOP